MKVTYIGDPNDPNDRTEGCTFAGVWFPKGEATTVPDSIPYEQRRKLSNHNHFSVEISKGPELAAATITASHIDVTELSAITANPGTVVTDPPKPKRKKKEA